MNCMEARALVEDALDKTIAGSRKRALDLHLSRCDSCRAFFAAEREEHRRWFIAMNEPEARRTLPDGFADEFLADMERRKAQPQRLWFLVSRFGRIAACVAAMLLFSLFSYAVVKVVGRSGDSSTGASALVEASAECGGEASPPLADGADVVAEPETLVLHDSASVSSANSPKQMKGDTIMSKVKAAAVALMAAVVSTPAVTVADSNGDGYIESEGDAYVSLGHCAGPNTKMEVDFQLTEVKYDTKPFGSWGDRLSIPMFSLFISYISDSTDLRFSWDSTDSNGNRQALNFGKADLKRHVISFDAPNRTYASTNVTDGGSAYSYTFERPFSTMTSPYPLAVFARGANTPATRAPNDFGGPTKMKVYGVKIYESGSLVKTYTPCLKGGIPGLKVTGPGVDTFVTGIDVTKVKYGGNILVEKDDPYISTGDYNSATNGEVAGKCIYMDIGYNVRPTSRIELDFAPLTPNIAASSYNHPTEFMFASGSSPDCYVEFYGRNSQGFLGFLVGRYNGSANNYRNTPCPLSTAYGIRRTVSVDSASLSLITAGYTNFTASVPTGYEINNEMTTIPLRLCAAKSDYGAMKIYGLKIYESGSLIRDYRPIVTNGVAGLIDVLNPSDIRYASTNGSGSGYALTFTAGGNHACADGSDEAYLEFDGSSERINTGIVVTKDSVIEADFALANAKYPSGQQQVMFVQDGSDGILARLYMNSEFKYSYEFRDYTGTGNAINSGVLASNERRQFKLDGPNARMTIKCGDDELYNQAITDGERTRTGGSTTLKIGNAASTMRLYGFKVTTNGSVVRDFVPCVTNGVAGLYDVCGERFYPLPGGRVRGKGSKGRPEFLATPHHVLLTRYGVNSTTTLRCVAPGALRYEWREDGVLIPGETSDSLTLSWVQNKPHTRTYSATPVYQVLGETVKGETVDTRVDFSLLGTSIIIR